MKRPQPSTQLSVDLPNVFVFGPRTLVRLYLTWPANIITTDAPKTNLISQQCT